MACISKGKAAQHEKFLRAKRLLEKGKLHGVRAIAPGTPDEVILAWLMASEGLKFEADEARNAGKTSRA